MDIGQQIEILVRAKYPIIYVLTWEENRAEEAIRQVASKLQRKYFSWSVTQGFQPAVKSTAKASSLPTELEALAQIFESDDYSLFLIKDYHPYLRDPRSVRLLRDLANRLRLRSQTLVLVSPVLNLPTDLEKDVTVLDLGLPDRDDISKTLDKVVAAVKDNPSLKMDIDDEKKQEIVRTAQGLTIEEIESVLARSLVEKKTLDVDSILDEKKQIIRKSGILEYFPVADKLEDVGGMELLKEWLKQRNESFSDRAKAFGLPAPKGILLLGVQGCGKSLLAKAVASHWRLPMLRLDVGRIFGSLMGQSEDNIRKAIAVSESIAPCILWADELEKGFGGASSSGVSDGGTTARVFATFLTWMQEKTSPVFLIATANDISALPPEMLRKGRFDEIFFVDLPDRFEREDIWKIHLKKRGRKVENFDVSRLSEHSQGFSGAEIEQAVVSGLFKAFASSRDLLQADLEEEIEASSPLSVIMKEDIDELRAWAAPRTRPASVLNN